MKWILASASPRRKELFKELVPAFEILPAKGEEIVEGNPTPRALAESLARQKAEEVSALPEAVGKAVLGADTVVAFRGEVFGKPKDEADAYRMLAALSGQTHEVYTGVCMSFPITDKDGRSRRAVISAAESTKVVFHELTDEDIRAYIATGSPMDKAGAYGIQDGGLVRAIEGSFSNVVGLPVELCKRMIKEMQEKMR